MGNASIHEAGIHIAGNFQGWNPSTTPLTDSDSDGIYEVTVAVESGTTLLYKFINGNSWGEGEESVPASCGQDNGLGGYNRWTAVADNDTILNIVCFGSCIDCDQNPEPTWINATFQLNMNSTPVSPQGVHIAGNFQNWDPGATQLLDNDGDGIYTVTVSVESGTTLLYKFINGNTWGSGEEVVPADCGQDNGMGGFNRQFTLGNVSEIIPSVCFSACSDCEIITMTSVSISVNMEGETIANQGVHIAGNFNEFNPAISEMTLLSDHVYGITLSFPSNSQLLYKFINGQEYSQAESVPFECGLDDGFGGYNRTFITGHSDVELPTVCFGACSNCIQQSNPSNSSEKSWLIYPNPANEFIHIQSPTPMLQPILFMDMYGRKVREIIPNGSTKLTLFTDVLAPGLYHLMIPGIVHEKILIAK